VGVTYLDNDPLTCVHTVPLYRERYVLITRNAARIAGLKSISWAMAATLPLCLLTPSMQNRRIIDMQFQAAGQSQPLSPLLVGVPPGAYSSAPQRWMQLRNFFKPFIKIALFIRWTGVGGPTTVMALKQT
jgi:hypothetical protein